MAEKRYLAIIVCYNENDYEYHKTRPCDSVDEAEAFFKLHENDTDFSHTAIEDYQYRKKKVKKVTVHVHIQGKGEY